MTLLITAISGYFMLKKVEIQNHKIMLENMIEQFIIIENDESSINDVVQKIKDKTGVRVTVIDAQGIVLYESNRDVKGMENHLNRPELVEASTGIKGSSIRYSKSVEKDFLYVSKFVDMRYIRMAYALDSIEEKFFKFWLKAIIGFTLAMLLAFWIAMKINRKVTDDLNYIQTSLDSLLNKNYELEFVKVHTKEFNDISNKIEKVSKKLEKRDFQKAKYTKNLKLLSKKQGDIISAISHEFKNPVAAIMGYTQTIQEDEDLSPAIRAKFLEKVQKNGQKINTMIDRLSLAVKLEGENFTPQFSKFNLKTLVRDINDTILQKYKNREIIVEIDDEIILKADQVMFDNLLTNLIENALKYSEEEVIVRVVDGKFEVIDKGIGIESEDLENITKRFFRIDSLSWDNSIGVGLYIVKYILKLHNRSLHIESEPNVGSKFWFKLP